MEELAKKMFKKIKNMNLDEPILRALNFFDVIREYYKKNDNQKILNDEKFSSFIDFIITNYTNLNVKEARYLWLAIIEDDFQELKSAVLYIDEFNWQIAKYILLMESEEKNDIRH